MTDEEVVAAAIREVLQPTFAVTEQILSVNRIATRDGSPVVIGWERRDEATFVFFEVEEQRYLPWVRVNNVTGAIQFAGVEAGAAVDLVIDSEHLTPDAISEVVRMQPTCTLWKGEPKRIGRGVNPWHSWVYTEPSAAVFLETRLARIAAVARTIAEAGGVPRDAQAEISIALYEWQGWTSGIHCPADVLAAFHAIRAAIDIDLYCSGPDLPDVI